VRLRGECMRLRIMAAGVLSVAFVSSALAAVCDPNDPSLLKPDLVALAPRRVQMLTRGTHQQLSLTTTIANIGYGPLVLTGQTISGPSGPGTLVTQEIWRTDGTTCTHTVGFFPFGTDGNVVHIDDFAEYQLRQDDPFTGPIVARFSKTALGSEDDFSAPGQVLHLGADHSAPEYGLVLSADSDQPVARGRYFLVIVVNPNGAILEKISNTPDDAGVASVRGGAISRRPRPRPMHRPVHVPRPPGAPPTSTPTPMPPAAATPAAARRVHRLTIILPPGHEGCGGHHAKGCSPGEFCQFAENRCGLVDDIGICTPMDRSCDSSVAPVCGCDGVTYANTCQRRRAGVSAAHQGPC
jgi:hypothetical protein